MQGMKTVLITLAATLLMTAVEPSSAAVSISVGDPGFYGRIDIGPFPPPRLIYEQPIVVRRVSTWYPPIYLRVPPGHVRHWYRYCDRYGACGRPVYFIDDDWYRDVYVPRYREYHHHRDYAPPPPPRRHQPTYYEYKRYNHKPPKKIYIEEGYYEDDHRGKGRHR
jgi:hypothetical protein